ncbi:cytochrome-c peroxidase [bacterium]|nr:cytochrome-c peroxidase [bacterium]
MRTPLVVIYRDKRVIRTCDFLLASMLTLLAAISPVSAENPAPPFSQFFSPLTQVSPPTTPEGKAKVSLGEKLYFDPILSQAKDISCNSCHMLSKWGVDNEPTSPGHLGQRGERNSPSVYNAALHLSQFWDGRAKDVEEQALGPVMNPAEMAMPSEEVVLERLNADKEYPVLFRKAFPKEKNPVSFQNMGQAIGAFERTLLTPSRFDQYLAGKEEALSSEEKKGLQNFVENGCTACHMGVGVGGAMYQKLGLVKPYPTKDLGRYEVTKQEADRYVFKVPSLRNVAKTGPYFHDGSVETLEESVKLMGRHQLGRELSEEQVGSIVAFLGTLTGELPEKYR